MRVFRGAGRSTEKPGPVDGRCGLKMFVEALEERGEVDASITEGAQRRRGD
jgi:hypothetical protein